MKARAGNGEKRYRLKGLNSILAHAAALMLTGIPAVVCESVLDEFYCSVKKSVERIRS